MRMRRIAWLPETKERQKERNESKIRLVKTSQITVIERRNEEGKRDVCLSVCLCASTSDSIQRRLEITAPFERKMG